MDTHTKDVYVSVCLCAQSCLTVCDPWTVALQAPLSMGFPRQGYWSGLPFPSPGDLPDPGIEPTSAALAGGFLNTRAQNRSLQRDKTLRSKGFYLFYEIEMKDFFLPL